MSRLKYLTTDDVRRLRESTTEEIRHLRIVASVMDEMRAWAVAFNAKKPVKFTLREAREMAARVVNATPAIASAWVPDPPKLSLMGTYRECRIHIAPKLSRNLEFTIYTLEGSSQVDIDRSLTGYGSDPAGVADKLESELPNLSENAAAFNTALSDLCSVSYRYQGVYPLSEAFGLYVLPYAF